MAAEADGSDVFNEVGASARDKDDTSPDDEKQQSPRSVKRSLFARVQMIDESAGSASEPNMTVDSSSSSGGGGGQCTLQSTQAGESGAVSSPERRTPAAGRAGRRTVASTDDQVPTSGTESIPEVRVTSRGRSRKPGRVVASRYKEVARAAAVPSPKLSDSCLSVNQSKLFSTARASTPVSFNKSAAVISPRHRQKDVRSALPPAAIPSCTADKAKKVKKTEKTTTVKVKPMRAIDPAAAKTKTEVRDSDRLVPEHLLLYNQYLQWTYMRKMAQASLKKEAASLSSQARQMATALEDLQFENLELERKLQALRIHKETAELHGEVTRILDAVSDSAKASRADLSRLTTVLDATRSRLQLKSFAQPTDDATYHEELVAATEKCRDTVVELSAMTAPDTNLLQRTADSVRALQQSVSEMSADTGTAQTMVQKLCSMSLLEASLTLTGGTTDAD